MVGAWAESLAAVIGLKPAPKRGGKAIKRNIVRAPNDLPRADLLETRLRTVLDRTKPHSGAVIGGSIEIVGLNTIRAALGVTWEMVRDRVRHLIQAELQEQLRAGDSYRSHKASAYLVCFVDIAMPEARRRLDRVTLHVHEALRQEFPFIRDRIRLEHFLDDLDGTILTKAGGRLADQLFAHTRRLKDEADRATLNAVPRLAGRSRILFWPSWGTSRNVVTFNRCILQRRFPAPRDEWNGEVPSDLDFLLLSQAAKALQGLSQSGRVAPLLVPVQYQTLSDPKSLAAYLALVEKIPEHHRRLFALQIVDIDHAHKSDAVLDVARQLAPWVKWLSLTLDLSDPRIPECAAAPVWALAVDLGGARSTDSTLYPKLRRLQAITSDAQLNTIAVGVNSIGLALAAVKAGITYIDGSVIHPIAPGPRSIGPLRPVLSAISSSRNARR